jgi:hypothetical protein
LVLVVVVIEMDTIASVVLAVYSLDNWAVAVDKDFHNRMEGMHWSRMTEVESHSLDREEEV